MSLKLKATIIITCIFIILGFVDFSIRQYIIFPSFLSLEKENAAENAIRVQEVINSEVQHLDILLHDWSAWDDTYEFVHNANEDYIKANLAPTTMESNQLNMMYFAAEDGHIAWSGINGLSPDVEKKLKEFLGKTIKEDHPLRNYDRKNTPLSRIRTSGLYSTPAGFFIVSSRPVLTTDNKGPARGALIMGTLIDDAFINRLSEQIKLSLTRYVPSDSAIESNLTQQLADKSFVYLIETEEPRTILNIYIAIRDITGKNKLMLKVHRPRKIVQTGYAATLYATISFLATMISALVVMLLLIHWLVVKPVLRLKDSVISAKMDNQKLPALMSRHDEIGVLGREFKQLLELLDERSKKLEDTNRQLTEDIDRIYKVEKALHESEEQLRTVLENLPVGVFIHDRQGNFRHVNDVGCRITGYDREEILKMNIKNIDPVEYSQEDKKMVARQFIEKGRFVFESTNTRKDGSTYPVEIHLAEITLNGEPLLLSLVFDITDRKKAEEAKRATEEQIARAKKMESLGLMAGGVAHDLNNVLSGIVSYPEMILMDLPEESRLRRPIETMHESGKRAVAIVQDLLTVARGVAVEKDIIDINRVVLRYLDSAEFKRLMTYNPGVTIKTELEETELNIKGAPVHIGKSLMNLVINAVEALNGLGKIVIKTENKYLDRHIRGYEEVKPGEYAVLSVADNGNGIEPKDLERIFEPFYSKKHMGRSGTGLGLAIVWNSVQEHNGYIDVSTSSKGTKFELYFPVSYEKALSENAKKSPKGYQGNGEKILIVDDVDTQREIFTSMLDYLGYKPVAVSSGEEAISYLTQNSADLIILDMIMEPGMSGKETYKEIIKINPGQKAIVASGFAETEDVIETQRLGAGIFIKKPVTMEKLGIAIREELEKKRG
jgi:two-component system, cell cycle sensor histidine kinase and response regulator CckA